MKLLGILFSILLASSLLLAQSSVTPAGGYYFDGVNWDPFTTTATAGALPAGANPKPTYVYGFNSTTGRWTPLPGSTSNGVVNATDIIMKGPLIDPRWFGAKDDGVTDDCTALNAASSYAASVSNGVFYLPYSPSGSFATSCTITFQTNWWVEGMLKTIAGGTAASTALVSTLLPATPSFIGIYGPGTINGNGLSPIIVWQKQSKEITIAVQNIIGMGINTNAIQFGDDAGVGGGGVGGIVRGVNFGVFTAGGNPTHTGSSCIYISGGNGTKGAYTDDVISFNFYHGCAIGVVDKTGQNNIFVGDHAWDEAGTTCFDEYAIGGTFQDEYCDSPSTYGFHVRNIQTRIINGTAYNGSYSGGSSTATAIQFDIPAEPYALVRGIRIYGADSSHQWLADTNLGFNATNTTWCDLRDQSNVVTKQEGTGTCLMNGNLKLFGSEILALNGMYTGTVQSFTCTTTCSFSFPGNWQRALLTANVTSSTWTIATPTGGSPYANFTVLICQNATGGFTFTPPTNSKGFGTPSTAANSCSVQDFTWDGSTLRAITTMQTNE